MNAPVRSHRLKFGVGPSSQTSAPTFA
jgi:hypothetical protein